MKLPSPSFNGNISPYSASITREQFLYYEMRLTAKLLISGMSEEQTIDQIASDNLFQYPTEKSSRRMALACLRRLHVLDSETLVTELAEGTADTARQICLYAMMRQNRLVRDFMVTVIGEKFRVRDFSFGKLDLNTFFFRLQEQDNHIDSWSDSTVAKIKQILKKLLVENRYLDNTRSAQLNLILLAPVLEEAIRNHNDEAVLPAFNCFWQR